MVARAGVVEQPVADADGHLDEDGFGSPGDNFALARRRGGDAQPEPAKGHWAADGEGRDA